MTGQRLIVGLLLSTFLAIAQLNGASPEYNDPGVKQLAETDYTANDTVILVSFLSAISQVPTDLGNLLRGFSQSRQASGDSSSVSFESSHVSTVGTLHNCFRMDFDGSMISGALKVAIDDINEEEGLLPNHILKYMFNNTCGDEKTSTHAFMEHWKMGARVFIGPESNCRTEAQMAASQNLPIISYKCRDKVVSDKKKYSTFARTAPAETDITKAFLTTMREFNWWKFSVIYESTTQANRELMDALKDAVENENKKAFDSDGQRFVIQSTSDLHQFSEIASEKQIKDIVDQTKDVTRIYVTFGSVRLFRHILQTMGEKGLMNDQKYLLIYLDPDYNWLDVYHAMNNHFVRNTMVDLKDSWDDPKSKDLKVHRYLRNTMAIIPTPVDYTSEKFVKFWNRSTQYLSEFGVYKDADHKWSVRYNRFACYLYDAVMLYARALHSLIEQPPPDAGRTYDPTKDGVGITKRIRGSYESICGFTMTINENHDAKGNYTLLSWQSVEPRPNINSPDYYPLDHALDITAVFVEDENGIPKLKFTRPVQWLDGVPADQPECGFRGELCAGTSLPVVLLVIFGVIAGIIATITSIVIAFVRQRKFEKELHSIWKIDWKEVEPIRRNEGSTLSLLGEGTVVTEEEKQQWLDQSCFAESDKKFIRDAARYHGSTVFLKMIRYEKRSDFTREIKMEMRMMRQLANPNINTFLGVSQLPNAVCVIRECCARGSLMDLLQNKDLKFDEVFIVSFVDDLIKGMTYLHESSIKVHGNLKSTNCLITTRWSLQVADFGLKQLQHDRIWDSDQQRWESLMWMAPEKVIEGNYGRKAFTPTQKADVYSFGIILHEMCHRLGPLSIFTTGRNLNIERVSEVVLGAINGKRAEISSDISLSRGVANTIIQCWDGNPDSRPEFRANGIRSKLRECLSNPKKQNVIDHMMELMEQYQLRLEDKVMERTKQLHDEQQRSEHLLQRMLPTGVASQLLKGGYVVPELFPAVTIYFSDIVGFTRIAGDSSPLQVVQFLNKLYTLFDGIVGQYEVYKIETIGDAYMVVAGVPKYTSKHAHAEQIGMMAMHLLAAVKNFSIPHLPNERLKLRIGMHTGSCVGGVVGTTMPRYCLFGDSVNTASRMESNGEPLKIHCSDSTYRVLQNCHGSKFLFEERGELLIKGKGAMKTYWLTGRQGYTEPEIPDPEFASDDLMILPSIFVRKTSNIRPITNRGSSWGLNRESTLSLQKDFSFLFRRAERSLPRNSGFGDATSVFYSAHNGGHVSVGSSYKELASVHEEDSGSDRSRNRHKFSRVHLHRLSNDSDVALRKRSTSLPDGENLNADQLMSGINGGPGTLGQRRNTDSHSMQSVSPSPSQYPSYRDINDEVQRKPGMSLTVWPSRKRSLSVGDNLPIESDSGVVDVRQHLLETKRRRSRKPFYSKDRKSVLSLHGVLRDPSPFARLRDASPFGRRSLWGSRTSTERSRGESLNRMWRRIRHAGSDYMGLDDSMDGSDESVTVPSVTNGKVYAYTKEDCAKEPLIKAELMV